VNTRNTAAVPFNRCANIIRNLAQYKLAEGIVEVQHTWIEWELVVDHVGGNQLNISAALHPSREPAEVLLCAIIQLRREFYTNDALEGTPKQAAKARPFPEPKSTKVYSVRLTGGH
jgi:hypothetical protein